MSLRRIASAAAAFSAAAALLAGCIENPGPDPDLHKPRTERVGADLSMQAGYLSFLFVREEGVTTLRVVNISSGNLDSGTCLVRAWAFTKVESYEDLRTAPTTRFTARLPALRPKQEIDLGPLGSAWDFPLEGSTFDVRAIRMAWRDEAPSHPLAGEYEGTWTSSDPAARPRGGAIRGILDAEGFFRLALHDSALASQLGWFNGLANVDGSLRDGSYTDHLEYGGHINVTGAFVPGGGRLRGAFGLGAGSPPRFDTLDLDLAPVPLP